MNYVDDNQVMYNDFAEDLSQPVLNLSFKDCSRLVLKLWFIMDRTISLSIQLEY